MVTRIDLREVPTGILVQSFEDDWRTTNDANESHLNYTTTLPLMVEWLKDNGWTVREWPGGARAFKGLPRPVRPASAVKNIHLPQVANLGQFNLQLDF